ncbi:hypothetical protein IFO70_07110 [Phormidium tenue FACHB-886]|nr:hypothetical protein [Phormidium tenue FACHB-886]
MKVVICPGVHEVALTAAFLTNMGNLREPLVYPTDRYPAYSPLHLLTFLHSKLPQAADAEPLLLLGFSAGVVAAIGAARRWQKAGGRVLALMAIDGWGVPLIGDFPLHRLSHDSFTHWSSLVLGAGQDSFYADPAVGHLELWRSPQAASGWWINSVGGDRIATTAEQFLQDWLRFYEQQGSADA